MCTLLDLKTKQQTLQFGSACEQVMGHRSISAFWAVFSAFAPYIGASILRFSSFLLLYSAFARSFSNPAAMPAKPRALLRQVKKTHAEKHGREPISWKKGRHSAFPVIHMQTNYFSLT